MTAAVSNASAIYRDRIRLLNEKPCNMQGTYVLYWCQSALRGSYNQALEFAKQRANWHKSALVVCIGIKMPDPWGTERYYCFMLEAIQELKAFLTKCGIKLVVLNDSPDQAIILLSKKAIEIVVDMNYLKIHRFWYKNAATKIQCSLTQIETNTIIPVEVTSSKEENDVDEFRRTLKSFEQRFLIEPYDDENVSYQQGFTWCQSQNLSVDDRWVSKNLAFVMKEVMNIDREIGDILKDLADIDRTVKKVQTFSGGYSKAREKLDAFLAHGLEQYDTIQRDNPGRTFTSRLSPYLSCGHVSPIEVALAVRKSNISDTIKNAFLYRMFVLRELSINVIWFNSNYDKLMGCNLPEWAFDSIKKHDKDPRPYIYTLKQMEDGQTDDPAWNAAQYEMVITGRMQSLMRLYWGKRVIEWTPDANRAYEILVYLNDKYQLDGYDPCSYCGIALCFGKFGHKSFMERPIFGFIQPLDLEEIKSTYGLAAVNSYVEKYYTMVGRAIERA